MDIDGDGGLDLEEFKRAVVSPTAVEQWAHTMPLAQLLAACIPDNGRVNGRLDPIRNVSHLTAAELSVTCTTFSEGLYTLLEKNQRELQRGYDEMDRRSKERKHATALKFDTFKMSCGSTLDFHNGLSDRIGLPHPDVKKGMFAEHCSKGCCDDSFTTDNYGLTTNLRKEYEIATGKQQCPESELKDKDGKLVRFVLPIAELMQRPLTKQAKLIDEEVLSAVLYTGPAYVRYNMILRRYPTDTYDTFSKEGNLLTTTIHVLVSAVSKIARVMKLPEGLKLYRGLGGLMELPECFWKADTHGCRGYLEWGFLSTTSNKEIAIKYSGVREGLPHAMLLKAEVGSINRGAYIGDFSQYPGEREYLWGPCSFIEPKGMQLVEVVPEGVVAVVPVSINAKLKALTVEQHVGHKRLAHLAAFRYAIDETRRDLRKTATAGNADERLLRDPFRVYKNVTYTVEGFLRKIVERCEAVLRRHEGVGAEEYLDDDVYRGLVVEMLHTKAAALATLRRYLEDPSTQIVLAMNTPLKAAHRKYVGFLRRTLAAAGEERAVGAHGLCQLMGLMRSSVDEADEEGNNPIMSAASDGAAYNHLYLLVAARANPEATDRLGRTPIYLAASYGHEETVEALHRLGASVNTARDDGTTPVYIAAQEGHVGAVEVLCRLCADVHKAQKTGATPLYIAAQKGHVAVVEALGCVGADLDKAISDGRAPLHAAAEAGNVEVLEALARHGADLNKTSPFGTPLAYAIRIKYQTAVEALRRLGAK